MRVEKHVTMRASCAVVWDCLWDIARLASCVPGCQTGVRLKDIPLTPERVRGAIAR
jgi:carbon monoxide dehydrogenase subunit G